jgi:hypothetical protein
MIKTFTQTDLIRYLYRETTEKETREIDNALICDSELRALFNELSSMKASMDKARIEPSSATVLNILSYSRGQKEHARDQMEHARPDKHRDKL